MTSVAAGLVLAAPARAAETAVIVVDDLDLARTAERGAVGLMVPGSGSTVSGRGARAALVRGEVESALTGGIPSGDPLITLGRRPADVTIYVALPPPGTHPNDRRYPIVNGFRDPGTPLPQPDETLLATPASARTEAFDF